MKSRKNATDDKSQSSLIFFFGKRPPPTTGDDEKPVAAAKKIDVGEDGNHAEALPDGHTEKDPGRPQYAGRRPAGGHNNPGRSRFFSRPNKASSEELPCNPHELRSDAAAGSCPGDCEGPTSCTESQPSPREACCDIDGCSAEELLEVASQAESSVTAMVDLTQDDVTPTDGPAIASDVDATGDSRTPYYLKNFRFILESVLGDEDSVGLLDEADMRTISAFQALEDDAQKLYVRLHNRRKGWHRSGKLEYSEIGSGLYAAIAQLSACELLHTEGRLDDLDTILRLLPAPDVKELAKSFRIQSNAMTARKSGKSGAGSTTSTSSSSGGGGGKQDVVGAILRHCRQQLSVFSATGTEAPVKKRAKALLGKCVTVPSAVRDVFNRLVRLFAVASWLDDDSQLSNGSNTVIYNLLLSSNGSIEYPKYTIKKETKLFTDRDAFLRFCAALELEHDLLACKENSQWAAALDVYTGSRPVFDECMEQRLWADAEKRPQFLLRFTDGWVLSRLMSQCVDIMERHRMYADATALLRLLLSGPFCRSSRGRWYDRLALDLDQHLRQRTEALDVVERGLNDEYVVTGHRLALQQRAVRLCTAASAPEVLRNRLSDFPPPQLLVAKEVEIPGRMYPGVATGTKSYFMRNYSPTGTGDGASVEAEPTAQHIMLLSVEELAMEHYRCKDGFECGIHAEGSSFSALFGLFFWDIIFDDSVADVFRNAYQAMPLDFYTQHFYEKRKEKIEHRVDELRCMDSKMVEAEVVRVWTSHHGTHCGCLNWDLFADMEQAVEFATCVGGQLLAGICSLLSKNYRHRRGGLPDLTLWSKKKKTCKFVEVKGPNDRLSHKQHMWMHHLVEMGADVDVCHVRAIGGKMLQ